MDHETTESKPLELLTPAAPAGPSPEKLAAREVRLAEFRAIAKRLIDHSVYLEKNETARSTLRLLHDIDCEATDADADAWHLQAIGRFDRLTFFVLGDAHDEWTRFHKKDGEVTDSDDRVRCARNTLISLDLIRDLANIVVREGIAVSKRSAELLEKDDES